MKLKIAVLLTLFYSVCSAQDIKSADTIRVISKYDATIESSDPLIEAAVGIAKFFGVQTDHFTYYERYVTTPETTFFRFTLTPNRTPWLLLSNDPHTQSYTEFPLEGRKNLLPNTIILLEKALAFLDSLSTDTLSSTFNQDTVLQEACIYYVKLSDDEQKNFKDYVPHAVILKTKNARTKEPYITARIIFGIFKNHRVYPSITARLWKHDIRISFQLQNVEITPLIK